MWLVYGDICFLLLGSSCSIPPIDNPFASKSSLTPNWTTTCRVTVNYSGTSRMHPSLNHRNGPDRNPSQRPFFRLSRLHHSLLLLLIRVGVADSRARERHRTLETERSSRILPRVRRQTRHLVWRLDHGMFVLCGVSLDVIKCLFKYHMFVIHDSIHRT